MIINPKNMNEENKGLSAKNSAQDENKKTKKIAKIVVKRDLCIGAATCIAIAGDTFELDNENIAIVKDNIGNSDEEILLAAQSCPTLAIYLYDEDGNQIFPEENK